MAQDKAAHLAAAAAKTAGKAHEAAKAATTHAMMGPSAAMGEMMAKMPMMGEGQMMANMPMMAEGHMMANMPMMMGQGAAAAGHAAKGAMAAGAAGAAMASSHNPGGLLSRLAKHPLLVFGLGLAAGYLIHRYRREIIGAATRVSEKGKDFLLHQRENLEDLVAESKEMEETAGKAKPGRSRAE